MLSHFDMVLAFIIAIFYGWLVVILIAETVSVSFDSVSQCLRYWAYLTLTQVTNIVIPVSTGFFSNFMFKIAGYVLLMGALYYGGFAYSVVVLAAITGITFIALATALVITILPNKRSKS